MVSVSYSLKGANECKDTVERINFRSQHVYDTALLLGDPARTKYAPIIERDRRLLRTIRSLTSNFLWINRANGSSESEILELSERIKEVDTRLLHYARGLRK